MISNDVDKELDQNIKGFYEFLKKFDKKIESNPFEKKENQKLSLYKISNEKAFRKILEEISVNNDEIEEFLKKKKEYDTIDSYKFIISIAICKYQENKLDYSFFDKEFFIHKSKILLNSFKYFSFNTVNMNNIKELECEIKIFFLNKLDLKKNKEIPSLSLYEAYRIYKFSYKELVKHLKREKLIIDYNKPTEHLEKIIKSKIKDEEALKKIKLLLKNSFIGLEIYGKKINDDDSANEENEFEENQEEYKYNNKLINQESEIFHKINEGLKKYNVSISLKEFDEALKLNMNNYNFSLDQNLDGTDDTQSFLDTMSSEIKEDDIVNEQSQMELLKALFSLFVSNNESKKLYRRKLYILFLEYILNMSNQDIADSICDSPASVSLAKKDLISDLSYLAKSNINFYLDNWFDKDNNLGDISKQDILEKLSRFDKEKKSYEENLLEYFNSKENSNSNIDNLRKGLLNFKISEEIRKLSQEDKNIISNLNEKLLKGNFLENQLDKYSKTYEQKNKLLLLLSKFPDKSELLKDTFDFNVDDFRSFIEFSEKSLSNKFTNIQKLFFQNIELINKKAENMNKDVFFLLLSLFSIASLEEIEYNNKKFIKFNSYNSFDDFETNNVLMKFISNIEMENDCLKFGELQGVSNAR